MQAALSALTTLDPMQIVKLVVIWLVVSVVVAAIEPGLRVLLWAPFNFVASLFSFAARATLTFIHFASARIMESLLGLGEEGQATDERPTRWAGWLIIGPLIYFVLLIVFVLCDLSVAELVFQAMGLTFGANVLANLPIPLDASMPIVFVSLALFFGIVVFDLRKLTPFAYIWSGLTPADRGLLLRIVVGCFGLELIAGLAMGIWSQAQLTGGLPQPWQNALPWLVRGCLVVLLLAATALSGKPSGSAITAAGVLLLMLVRAVAFVVLVVLQLVLVCLRQLFHLPLALVTLVGFVGHRLWNWLAGFGWARAARIGLLTTTPLAELGGDADSPLEFRAPGAEIAAREALASSHKHLARRLYEEVYPSPEAPLHDFFAADVLSHDGAPGPAGATGVTGTDHVARQLEALRAEFAGLQVQVEDQVADGDRVVSRIVLSGTPRRAFASESDQPVRLTGVDTLRIQGERVVERWGTIFDTTPLTARREVDRQFLVESQAGWPM